MDGRFFGAADAALAGTGEQAEVSTHFPLFLKTGEAARNAPEEIQKILLEQGEKKGS